MAQGHRLLCSSGLTWKRLPISHQPLATLRLLWTRRDDDNRCCRALDSTAKESVRGPCSMQAQDTVKLAAFCSLQIQLGDLQASFVSMSRLLFPAVRPPDWEQRLKFSSTPWRSLNFNVLPVFSSWCLLKRNWTSQPERFVPTNRDPLSCPSGSLATDTLLARPHTNSKYRGQLPARKPGLHWGQRKCYI